MALEDTSALKCKEWNRGEPGEDTPQMFSTIDGKLTPTAPVYEDMRTETPLNVTPEEWQDGLSGAMGGMEENNVIQQFSEDARGPVPNVVPTAVDVSETSPKVINERSSQEGLPRRNEVSWETSQEDTLAATRLFFNTLTERRNVPEVLVESEPLEPLVLEGLPDELGPEWRVLHPFEIPGVRFPTEDTPPNHRRLAESDALVELIQTAEYLEDAPSWGQRRFYLPQYGDPYYRGWGRGHGRGRGRGRNWLNEDLTERDSGRGWGRTSFHGNGRGQESFQRNLKIIDKMGIG